MGIIDNSAKQTIDFSINIDNLDRYAHFILNIATVIWDDNSEKKQSSKEKAIELEKGIILSKCYDEKRLSLLCESIGIVKSERTE